MLHGAAILLFGVGENAAQKRCAVLIDGMRDASDFDDVDADAEDPHRRGAIDRRDGGASG
jgi:hypothetical protein